MIKVCSKTRNLDTVKFNKLNQLPDAIARALAPDVIERLGAFVDVPPAICPT